MQGKLYIYVECVIGASVSCLTMCFIFELLVFSTWLVYFFNMQFFPENELLLDRYLLKLFLRIFVKTLADPVLYIHICILLLGMNTNFMYEL